MADGLWVHDAIVRATIDAMAATCPASNATELLRQRGELRRPADVARARRSGARFRSAWYESSVTGAATEALMRVALFADLDEAEVRLLAELAQARTFSAGETVTAEGDVGDGFFVIESGDAEVMVQGQPRGTLTSGDCFGEIAMLMGSERTARITAISDLHCYCITPSDFRAVVEENPSIAWKLYQSMAERLSDPGDP